MKFRNAIFIFLGIVSFSLVLFLYPQTWIVLWVKYKFNSKIQPKLFITPESQKNINRSVIPYSTDVEVVRVHNLVFKFIESDNPEIEKLKDNWFRIDFGTGGLLIMGDMPSALKNLKENKIFFFEDSINNVDTNYYFLGAILNANPSEFNFSMSDPYSKFVLLNLKIATVPETIVQGYYLDQKYFKGYQMGDPNLGDEIVFIHIFDKEDNWYQLIFKAFPSKEIDSFLSRIEKFSNENLKNSKPNM